MHWTQTLYLVLLLIGSGAAITKDRWFLVAVLWMNFGGTVALSDVPFAVGVIDIVCATFLMAFGDRRAYVISGLFVAMVILYPLEQRVGRSALYAIIDVIAYAQVVVIGGGGFGELLRNVAGAVFGVRRDAYSAFMGGGGDFEGSRQDDMAGRKKRGNSE